ncbi:MAG: thiol-disulfide oxidoreductase DCC family protein [Microscillaceae bacterium]|nr:thiol-disulfide oxidoreductase DCC family protein [Microscillaceae bacterium]
MAKQVMSKSAPGIILFDGVCNLCNSSVDFIIRRDPKAVFKFASLQSEEGQKLLKEHQLSSSEFDSIVLILGVKHFTKSTAALKIAFYLRFPWNLIYGLIIFPAFIRDFMYNFIARNRYRFFGKKETCRIPTPEERSRFL